eukprot:CAMPEP_0176162766 /NCGR_PEP_ID=MMETSP0120_2-20121206/83271_1 /TAXON_ID=160619 /ORGANISM="Kryptoperidinium foliaceum, Strain CCMP 1326" /LENGTH=483 /DNA_ID=CAMNT_0017500275 /DNA_START=13 /DNA_END=1463 /DNA_ORIENTATION=+
MPSPPVLDSAARVREGILRAHTSDESILLDCAGQRWLSVYREPKQTADGLSESRTGQGLGSQVEEDHAEIGRGLQAEKLLGRSWPVAGYGGGVHGINRRIGLHEVAGVGQSDGVVGLEEAPQGQDATAVCIDRVRAMFGIVACFGMAAPSHEDADFVLAKGGLDYFWPLWSDLRFWGHECQDYRLQIWRWFTYQFTHDGIIHVLLNCFLLLALGIPLEEMHGHLRMIYLFNIGVFGGACCSMVLDPHTAVVGCSGGCYALIGVHLADLMLNWSQKKFRIPTLVIVVLLIFVGLLGAWTSLSPAGTSHTAHLGGAVAGLCAGLTFIKNIKVEHCERYIISAAWVIGLSLGIFCVVWLFVQDGGPRSLEEALAGEKGWCWYAQTMEARSRRRDGSASGVALWSVCAARVPCFQCDRVFDTRGACIGGGQLSDLRGARLALRRPLGAGGRCSGPGPSQAEASSAAFVKRPGSKMYRRPGPSDIRLS